MALCVYFGEITKEEAQDIFNGINSKLMYPTKDTFEDQYEKSIRRFERNGWRGPCQMKGESINDLKKYLSMGRSLKICILDNNSVEFLTWVRKDVSPEKIFSQYDMILIPQWVWIKVCDSENRKSYIDDLKHYSKVQIIDEVDYLTLVDYKEAELYYLFLYCCYNVSRLVSFIKKNILKIDL